jgi:hypothetical protein
MIKAVKFDQIQQFWPTLAALEFRKQIWPQIRILDLTYFVKFRIILNQIWKFEIRPSLLRFTGLTWPSMTPKMRKDVRHSSVCYLRHII